MEKFEEIPKIEAARRHLVAGVELFFNQTDPVVVHTVAFAAYQIMSDLCVHHGIRREIEDSEILESLGARAEVVRAFRHPHNFFKHADKDPTGVVRFFPDSNYVVLLLASEYYAKVVGEVPSHCQVLRLWFFVKHPEHAHLLKQWAINPKELPVSDPDDFEFFRSALEYAANKSIQRTRFPRR